jgi:hypothetical protein
MLPRRWGGASFRQVGVCSTEACPTSVDMVNKIPVEQSESYLVISVASLN